MKLEHKYIIGTHVMFYEVDMVADHVQSICNALDTIDNTDNVRVDLFFNVSEYFEKIDTSKITKDELIAKFLKLVETKFDYVIWGESDCLLPKEVFHSLEQIKQYASQNGIHRYVTTFAIRKMWDESWKVLEHVDMTDKPVHEKHIPGTRTLNPKAYSEPYSIRYTMSNEEMNEINSKYSEFDIQIISHPQFDGSGLVLSSDLLKNGVNIPHCIMGHLVDDTSMMHSCKQQMGDSYIQFIVKNVLKVHNREHPKKRMYALDMDSNRDLAESKFNTYKEFETSIGT